MLDSELAIANALRDLANLRNTRVLLVAASELMSGGNKVNEGVLGTLTQLSAVWSQGNPESPLNVVVVDNMTGGMPKVLSSRLIGTGTKGVPLFTVMNSDEAGVAVTPLAGETYGAIDLKIVGTLLVGLFGQAPGVRVLTGRKNCGKICWKKR